MSDAGVPIEKIARLVGHTGTTTTETVYRKQIRPLVIGGAEAMDSLFPSHSSLRTTEVVYRRELRPIPTTGAEAMDRLFNPRAS